MDARTEQTAIPAVKETKRKHLAEAMIVLVILAGALAAFSLLHLPAADATATTVGGPFAVVQNTEGFYQAVPLSQDESFVVASSSGTNHVTVSEGSVVVDEADCPNQVCVQAGAVNRIGDTIVCLPHKLVVQVVADPSEASPVQGITG